MAAFKPFNKISRRDFLRRQQRKRISIAPTPPQENWVAQLNGDGQYWQLSSEIPPSNNFEFSIFTQIEVSGPAMIVGANGSSAGCVFYNDGKIIVRDTNSVSYTTSSIFQIGTGEVFKIRIKVVNGDLSLFVNEVLQSMDRANNSTFSGLFLHRVGRRVEDAFYNKGVTYGFKLKDGSGNVTNEIPLTNKAQGATQLATVGNVNATMIGYNENVWVKESDI